MSSTDRLLALWDVHPLSSTACNLSSCDLSLVRDWWFWPTLSRSSSPGPPLRNPSRFLHHLSYYCRWCYRIPIPRALWIVGAWRSCSCSCFLLRSLRLFFLWVPFPLFQEHFVGFLCFLLNGDFSLIVVGPKISTIVGFFSANPLLCRWRALSPEPRACNLSSCDFSLLPNWWFWPTLGLFLSACHSEILLGFCTS